MGNILRDIVEQSGLSVLELATVSGVPKSNIYRYLSGQAEPSVDVLQELARGADLSVQVNIVPLSEGEAGLAARVLLGDASGDISVPVQEWIARLQRNEDTDIGKVLRAGRAAAPLWRQGAHYFRGDVTTLTIASAGDISGGKWALSGAPVLEALGEDEVRVPTLLWCEQPDAVAQALRESMREVPQPDGAHVVVVPAIHSELVGALSLEGVWIVSLLQGLVDLAGLGADAREAVRRYFAESS